MKLLFLSTQLPYPPHKGGLIKSFRLLKYLSTRFDVQLICPLVDEDTTGKVESLQKEIPELQIQGLRLDKKRSIQNFVKSYTKGKTLNEWRKYSEDLHGSIIDRIYDFDIILVDHYEMFQYVPHSFEGKVVLHTHNAEYKMWERFAALSLNPLKKMVLLNESKRILTAELTACSRSDLIFAAREDIHHFYTKSNKTIPLSRFKNTYHLGHEEFLQLPELAFENSEKALLFFGTLSWEANKDGLLWFIKNVWPKLLVKEPKLTFYVVGKNPPKDLRQFAKKYGRIIFTGFVEDLDIYFRKCRVFVNPIRFGSGIKVKMIDAMYRGIPTISSLTGVESLEIENGKEYRLAQSVKDWERHILALLEDKELWLKLSQTSRIYAQKNLLWEPMLEDHFQQLWQLLQIKEEKHAV